jgi:hypothetical protein
MSCNEVKKYKYTITDKLHNIRYEIYSNREMSKKDKILQIRLYFYENDCCVPASDSVIMIVCKD